MYKLTKVSADCNGKDVYSKDIEAWIGQPIKYEMDAELPPVLFIKNKNDEWEEVERWQEYDCNRMENAKEDIAEGFGGVVEIDGKCYYTAEFNYDWDTTVLVGEEITLLHRYTQEEFDKGIQYGVLKLETDEEVGDKTQDEIKDEDLPF